MELTETALFPDSRCLGLAFRLVRKKSEAYLVETTADVVSVTLLLATGDGSVGRNLIPILNEDPGNGTTHPALVVRLSVLLGSVQPVLEFPDA